MNPWHDGRRKTRSGTDFLPPSLTAEELDAAPVLESADVLLIGGLTDDEDDAFAAATAP